MRMDPTISYALGSPMRAYGMDRGGDRGRATMERPHEECKGFTVAGRRRHRAGAGEGEAARRPTTLPLSTGRRKLIRVLDNRGKKEEEEACQRRRRHRRHRAAASGEHAGAGDELMSCVVSCLENFEKPPQPGAPTKIRRSH